MWFMTGLEAMTAEFVQATFPFGSFSTICDVYAGVVPVILIEALSTSVEPLTRPTDTDGADVEIFVKYPSTCTAFTE